jgi:PPOX class probable F420-dependent enzyme
MNGWSLRMPYTIPDPHKDLIAGPVYCVLTTVSPEGGPENTIVWSSWDGSHVLVNTADGRLKAKNIRNNPKVALIALDPMDALRWIDVRGIVEEIVEDKDFQNINAHAKLYTGNDEFFGEYVPEERKYKEKRIIFKIKPERVVVSES